MTDRFPPSIRAAAIAAMHKYHVPASITLAQWAVESAFGHAMPAGSNNPFGIKAVANQPFVSAWTHEVIHGRTVRIIAKFAKFSSIDAAFEAHAHLIASCSAYTRAMSETTPDAFADALTGVYATDPNYGATLKHYMKAYNLYAEDLK
jgi:flagellum-specific peptidoglycan hydrolase FlgJ